MNTKKKLIFIAIFLVIAGGIVGFVALNKYLATQKLTDLSAYDNGIYPYNCAEGDIFDLHPSEDMTSILLVFGVEGENPPQIILTQVPSESGARYEGDGLSLTGKGETITIGADNFSTTCVPTPVADQAPLNFGD